MTHHKLTSPAKHLANVAPVLGKGDIGVEVTDTGHSLRNVRLVNGGFGVKLIAPTYGVVIDNLVCADQQDSGNDGYGLFASTGGQPVWHDDLLLVNPQITFNKGTSGQHCIRVYGLRNTTIVGGTLANFANYRNSQTSPQTGATLNVKQASGLRIYGLTTQGKPPGFEHDRTNASEANNMQEDILLVGCSFDMNGDWLASVKGCSPFRIGSNVRRFKAVDCSFIQRNAKVPIVEVVKGAVDVTFERCSFSGGSKRLADGQFSDTTTAKFI